MSITIKGLKHLDANMYNKIIIREKKGKYQVDVKEIKEGNNFPTTKTHYRFSDYLKGKTDEEKIIDIVENFLRYTKVTRVKDSEYFSHYDGRFSVIRGSRELDLQIYNEKLRMIPKLVMDKYKMDREVFCRDNNDVEFCEIWLNYRESSYERVSFDSRDYIKLQLLSRKGKLASFEKEFLQEFLYDKLYSQGEVAEIRSKRVYSPANECHVDLGHYLVCGNFRARLDTGNNFMIEVNRIVNRYNSELRNAKRMQLKMEGF